MSQVYFDNAASTEVLNEVLDTYNKVVKMYANSSSGHNLSISNFELFSNAKKQCVNLLDVNNDELFFTSGASESINTILKGFAFANMNKGKHIISTTIEHPSTLNSLKYLEERFGFEVTYIKPENSELTVDQVASSLRSDTILGTFMHVQSELGYILPVEGISKLLRENGIAFHGDICQSLGKISVDFSLFDMFSASFHKIHGLKGSGLMVIRNGFKVDPLIHGGNQQISRSGTIPLELIVAGAKVLRMSLESLSESNQYVTSLWNHLYNELVKIDCVSVNSKLGSPFIMNFSLRRTNSSAVVREVYNNGFAFSMRTACSSSKSVSATVLDFTDDIEKATNSIRISFSKFNTIKEIDLFIDAFKNALKNVGSNKCG